MDNANIDWKRYMLELCMLSYNVNGDQEKELAKVIHTPGMSLQKLNSLFSQVLILPTRYTVSVCMPG